MRPIRRSQWLGILLLTAAFFASPAGAHSIASLLGCLPPGGGMMMPTELVDSVSELPAGG
jgi:hypothetical protein